MPKSERELALEQRIIELESKLRQYEMQQFQTTLPTVKVFSEVAEIFEAAEKTVGEYFSRLKVDPAKASIEIAGQRYILMRASSLSVDFFNTIRQLYADKGKEEAFAIGQNFLFDIAHVIGMEDAKNFHEKTGLTDPIAKLSAGPVHFAYAGWAFVELLPDSTPSPDENYYIHYRHPYSFEADSWIQAGIRAEQPVCIMNAGYSSGWCEESFGMSLTAVELTCKACGDEHCTFIMAPPNKIESHLEQYSMNSAIQHGKNYTIPSFFIRKEVEEQIRLAKEKAEASDIAKSEFLANMSHEIRTPLNAIMGYASLLQKEKMPECCKQFVDNIQDGSQHLLNVVNGILDLSKIEAGQLMLNIEPCDLMELLNKSQSTALSLLSKGQDVTIELKVSGAFRPFIMTDVTKLQQILYNLLSNAVKFTAKGYIDWGVNFDAESKMLRFFVKDSGMGIETDKIDQIFEKFKQIDNSITRKFGGTGLGLTISKSLVELLGGKIEVDSQLGSGAYFSFTHPYFPYNAPISDPEATRARNVHAIENSSILLVDDNEINLKLTSHILIKKGCEVILARNGQEAVDAFFDENNRIDLILMDIQMPVMDGLQATQMIRQHKRGTKIPIIAFTAHAMKGDMNRCLEAGCNAYLTKPIGAEELIEKIRQLL